MTGQMEKNLSSVLGADSKITDQEKVESILPALNTILSLRFGDGDVKTTVKVGGGRLNFSCPYCGDSVSNPRKKRGNIFLGTLGFHCYNCSYHRTLQGFLSDHGIAYDDLGNLGRLALDSLTARKINSTTTNSDKILGALFDDNITSCLFDREEIKQTLGLIEVYGSTIENYLQKRMQTDYDRFLWDRRKARLYILNSRLSDQKVIGWQIRNFGNEKNKYLTYKWSRISEILGKSFNEEDVDVDTMDKLSYTFNVFNVNFSKLITVFEGPMDSFLFPNSIALSSLHNNIPFEYTGFRYLFDFDVAGQKKTLEFLKEEKSVFLWKKFLKENDINFKKSKVDWTDAMIYCRNNQKKIHNVSQYFTDNKYDVIHL